MMVALMLPRCRMANARTWPQCNPTLYPRVVGLSVVGHSSPFLHLFQPVVRLTFTTASPETQSKATDSMPASIMTAKCG
jgi:hypothetical protein